MHELRGGRQGISQGWEPGAARGDGGQFRLSAMVDLQKYPVSIAGGAVGVSGPLRLIPLRDLEGRISWISPSGSTDCLRYTLALKCLTMGGKIGSLVCEQ